MWPRCGWGEGAAEIASLGVNIAAGAGRTYTSSTDYMAESSEDRAVIYISEYFATQSWIPQSMIANGSF